MAPEARRALPLAPCLLVTALLVALLLSAARPAYASTELFRLGPGGTAEITFVAYCTEFGKFFPQQIQGPDGSVAADPIPAALDYIANAGISTNNDQALEANFAIWQLAGATRATGGGQITQDVINNSGTPPASPAGGLSLLEAAGDGRVTLSVREWAPIGPQVQILSATDHFYGRGVLVVQNSSTETLELYMPTGTIFPGSETRFQRMGAYTESVNLVDARLPSTSGGEQTLQLVGLVAVALLLAGLFTRRRARVAR